MVCNIAPLSTSSVISWIWRSDFVPQSSCSVSWLYFGMKAVCLYLKPRQKLCVIWRWRAAPSVSAGSLWARHRSHGCHKPYWAEAKLCLPGNGPSAPSPNALLQAPCTDPSEHRQTESSWWCSILIWTLWCLCRRWRCGAELTSCRPLLSISATHSTSSWGTRGGTAGVKSSSEFWNDHHHPRSSEGTTMGTQDLEKDCQLLSAHHILLSCTPCRAVDDDSLFALWVSDHTAVPALHCDLPEADPFSTWCASLGTDYLQCQSEQYRKHKADCTGFIYCLNWWSSQPVLKHRVVTFQWNENGTNISGDSLVVLTVLETNMCRGFRSVFSTSGASGSASVSSEGNQTDVWSEDTPPEQNCLTANIQTSHKLVVTHLHSPAGGLTSVFWTFPGWLAAPWCPVSALMAWWWAPLPVCHTRQDSSSCN